MGLSGREWVDLVQESILQGPQASTSFLSSDLKIDSALVRNKILADVRSALVWEQNAIRELAEERSYAESLSNAAAKERQKYETSLTVLQGNPPGGSPEFEHRKPTARIDHAPKLPAYTSTTDRSAAADDFQVYGKSLSGWIEVYDSSLSLAITQILERNVPGTIDALVQGLSEESRKLDTALGAQIFSTAPPDTKREMLEDTSRKFRGRTSALVTLATWLNHVDGNSKKRVHKKLTEWLQRAPTAEPWQLHDDLNQFKRDMGGMCRMGAWEKDNEMSSSMIEGALDRLISKLCEDPKLLKDLTSPYAAVTIASDHNIEVMIKTLTDIAMDLADSKPSSNAAQRNKSSSQSQGAHAAAPGKPLFEPGKMICLVHRENAKCSRHTAGTCRFNHKMRSGKLCTDKEYCKSGICSKFKECLDTHPWDPAVFGPISAVPIAVKGAGIQKLYLDVVGGKTCAMMPGASPAMLLGDLEADISNPLDRAGRGQRSEAYKQWQIARANALVEDFPSDDSEFEAAFEADDLSDATVHTSQDDDDDDDAVPAEATAPSGAEPEGLDSSPVTANTTEAELTESTWESTDASFEPTTVKSTEDIISDADGDSDPEDTPGTPTPQIESILVDHGWTASQIGSWKSESIAAASAMSKSRCSVVTVPEGMDETSGDMPDILLMVDDGSFKHLAGNNAMHLAVNIRDIEPYPVLSASGDTIWLSQSCDLILNHCEFRDCLVNPHLDITLLSEGWLHMAEGWEFLNNKCGKLITTPDGYKQLAYRRGVTFYLPAEFIPTCEPNQAMFDSEFDQSVAIDRGYCDADMNAMVNMAVTRSMELDELKDGAVDDDTHLYSPPPGTPEPPTDDETVADATTESEASMDWEEDRDGMCICSEGAHGSDGCRRDASDGSEFCEDCEVAQGAEGACTCECQSCDDVKISMGIQPERSEAEKVLGGLFSRAEIQASMKEAEPTGTLAPVPESGAHSEGALAKATSGHTDTDVAELREVVAKFDALKAGALKEMQEHINRCHTTELKSKVDGKLVVCPHCLLAKMIAKGARQGSTREPHDFKTCAVDTLVMSKPAVSGSKYATQLVMYGSLYGQLMPGKHNDSVSTARRFRLAKSRIESITDPGGKWKIEALRHDPGTEFEGAMRTEREINNIFDFKGATDRHTSAHLAENRNRIVQRLSAAVSLTAFDGEHDQTEELTVLAWDEIAIAASECANHSSITADQRASGQTAIEEQSHGRIKSAEHNAKVHAPGTLVYGFIPQRLRDSKHSPRAFKAIYMSRDQDVLGNVRVMPFEARSGKWKLFPVRVVDKIIAVPGVFPLRANPENESSISRCDQAWKDLYGSYGKVEYVSAERVTEVGDDTDVDTLPKSKSSDAEVQDVVGRIIDDSGNAWYQLTWVGFDKCDSTWHKVDALSECTALVAAFEERIAMRGESDLTEVYAERPSLDGAFCGFGFCCQTEFGVTSKDDIPGMAMGAAEIPVDTFVQTAQGRAAVQKEIDAMTTKCFGGMKPRLIPMTDAESAKYRDPHSREFKSMLKLRLTCSEKRATPEELDHDPKAVGISKARLVAQDFKQSRYEAPENTYAPVPEASVFRLVVASHPPKDNDCSATDFTNAYLQGKGFAYDPTKPKEGQWIAVRYMCPLVKEWKFLWMSGEIYGRQPAGNNWHETLSEKQASIGLTECKNAKSVYVSKTGDLVQCTHVDDPITFTKKTTSGESVMSKYYKDLSNVFELKGTTVLTPTCDLDYLSVRVSISAESEICLSNAKFVMELIDRKGLTGCNPASSPISKDLIKLVASETELGDFLDAQGKTEYQADLGSLNWITQLYCPKLATAVSLLGKYAAAPTKSCPSMIKQTVRWLAGNIDMCLKTQSNNNEGIAFYCDSDLAGLHSVSGETRSRMGILGTYNGMPFYWNSSWIKATCTSSAEAEVYALSECVKVAVHFKWICEELNIPAPAKIPIFCDALAAIGFFKNLGGVTQSKLKHIDLRAQWVTEMRDSKNYIELKHIPGVDNPADFFTKVLTPIEFKRGGEALMSKVELPASLDKVLEHVSTRGHGEIANGICG